MRSPEQALLVDLLRARPAERGGGDVEPIDWHVMLEEVRERRLVGPVTEALRNSESRPGAPAPPEWFTEELRRNLDHLVCAGLLRCAELLRMLSLFEKNTIRAVPFKGPVFAERFYGSHAARPAGDLDILVPHAQVVRAKELLLTLGYVPEQHFTPAQERRELRRNCEYNMAHPHNRTRVELHWRLFERYIRFDLDEQVVLDRRRPVTFLGREVAAIPPEEMLVIMCVHNGAKHQWDEVRSVYDIDRIVGSTPDLDWKQVMMLAGQYHVKRIVRIGLALARSVIGTGLPDAVDAWIATDPEADTLREEYESRLFVPRTPEGKEIDRNAPGDIRRYFRSRERIRDRMRYLPFVARSIFRPTDQEDAVFALPPALRFLYYVLRPVRLALRYLGRRSTAGEQS
jgi:hypothetical protein